MLLLSQNDPVICVPSSSLPIFLHLCSSTHPLTSRANSTCLTRLSALWCKERETLIAPRGERKRDERRREWRREEGKIPISSFPSPPKPKLSFHRLPTELLRKTLAEEVAENTELAPSLKPGLPGVRCL